MIRNTRIGKGVVVLVAVMLGGCTSLPDVGPFATATGDLRSAVAASGQAAESELRHMEGGKEKADAFAKEWVYRDAAMTGLVDYADAVVGVVSASEKAGASYDRLTEGVKALATSAGISMPGSGVVSRVTDAGRLVYEQIARMKAAKSLEATLAESQPAIEQIVTVIRQDLPDAAEVLLIASTNNAQSIRNDQPNQIRLGFRKELERERDNIYAAGASALNNPTKARLSELTDLIEATNSWYEPLQEKLDEMARRRAAGQELFEAAGRALEDWAMLYKQLVVAVRDRRPVNTRSLVEATGEIRMLLQRMRE